MTEAQIYQRLRKAWAADSSVHATRIESWIGRGIPDVNWVHHGDEFWTELKVLWINEQFKESLKKEQVAWLLGHTRAGGRAWVVAQIENDKKRYFAWWGSFALRLGRAGRNDMLDTVPLDVPHVVAYSPEELIGMLAQKWRV